MKRSDARKQLQRVVTSGARASGVSFGAGATSYLVGEAMKRMVTESGLPLSDDEFDDEVRKATDTFPGALSRIVYAAQNEGVGKIEAEHLRQFRSQSKFCGFRPWC